MLELKFLPEENSVEEKEETRKVEVEEEVELSLTGNTHTGLDFLSVAQQLWCEPSDMIYC